MTDFLDLPDLASERLGGTVMYANDEFFAPKENLLRLAKPVFIEGKYTDAGKWMDGWETRRRRTPGYDWCLIRLGVAGIIRGIVVDTSFFRGNYPEQCSIDGCAMTGNATVDELVETEWTPLLPKAALNGDSRNPFSIGSPYRFTHLRLKIFPDGGVARLRVHGEPLTTRLDETIDLAAMENGGQAIAASDMFYSSRHNLLLPGRPSDMGDSWETKRRRGPGYDWVILKLAEEGSIERMEVDTSHFKGNFPESCSLEVCDSDGNATAEILPRTKLQAHTRHFFEDELARVTAIYLKFSIYPDGGVGRLRLYGSLSENGRAAHRTRVWNSLLPADAEAKLLGCCGSKRWAARMAGARPFADSEQMFAQAERIWWELSQEDWQEAFSSHPRIGERGGGRYSQQEQAAAALAQESTLNELARLNREYASRFGYIYIVCATGKTAEEMLELLRARLHNDPETELRIAAAEQSRITRLRLVK